jgi:hypothetical protein
MTDYYDPTADDTLNQTPEAGAEPDSGAVSPQDEPAAEENGTPDAADPHDDPEEGQPDA